MAETETLDGYELVNCVATGGVTQIWEIKRPGAAQSQAMKLLLPEAFNDPEHKKSLKHEATVGKSLSHPNLITILDLKITKKFGYFTMEYFRSPNLKGMIRGDHTLVKSKAKRVMECVSQALVHMHEKGWIHKDVKPDNVLLTKGGEVRLIDFSLASRAGNVVAHAMTRKSNIAIQGTRTYLAPELIRREVLTPSADIYSLGVLLYEMLTGNPPFRTANPNDLLMMQVRDTPANPASLDDNISPEADALVMKMLAKQPKLRQANMQEVFSEVRKIEFYKRDPQLVAKEKAEKVKGSDAQAMNDLLDSRMDVERQAKGIKLAPRNRNTMPTGAQVKELEKKPAPKPGAAAPAPAAGPAPAMPMPGYPGMPMPGMPPYGYPGMPMQPGMPMMGYPGYPGMPMPGMPMPGMPMPGMAPPPGYPGMPFPGQFPGQQFPGQQFPSAAMPGVPQPGGPVPQPAPPRPSPAVPPPVATQPKPAAPAPPAADIPVATLDDLQIE